MSSWPVQEAKARFSELLKASLEQGPQIVTKRGLDAAVLVPISEWRRLQEAAPPRWKELLLAPEPRLEQLFLSAVPLVELQAGVEVTRQQDPAKAEATEGWIDAVAASHNILPADGAIFRRWAQLMHHRPVELIEDAVIAATALIHHLTVATRNLREFERLGVPAVNPFDRAR